MLTSSPNTSPHRRLPLATSSCISTPADRDRGFLATGQQVSHSSPLPAFKLHQNNVDQCLVQDKGRRSLMDLTASHHQNSSPSNSSPLLSFTKRRLMMEVSQMAGGSIASLALQTPAKHCDQESSSESEKSDVDVVKPVISVKSLFARSMTMPAFAAPSSKLPMPIWNNTNTSQVYHVPQYRRSQPQDLYAPPLKVHRSSSDTRYEEQLISYSQQHSSSQPSIINHSSSSFSNPHSGEHLSLPHTSSSKDALKRISPQTLARLLQNQTQAIDVVDCRFGYEYDGGHIRNAVNINTHEALRQIYFEKTVRQEDSKDQNGPKIMVFHCEFSACRGPNIALQLRSQDRLHNACLYPQLTYPELYILEGGYASFYALHPHLCTPSGYVQMKSSAGDGGKDKYLDERLRGEMKQGKRSGSFLRVGSGVHEARERARFGAVKSFCVESTNVSRQESSTDECSLAFSKPLFMAKSVKPTDVKDQEQEQKIQRNLSKFTSNTSRGGGGTKQWSKRF